MSSLADWLWQRFARVSRCPYCGKSHDPSKPCP